MENTKEMIRKYIASNILFSGNGYPYSDDASFLNEGIIDSMNVLELVMFVEQSFGIKVDDQDIVPDNFDSITKLATFIESKSHESENNAIYHLYKLVIHNEDFYINLIGEKEFINDDEFYHNYQDMEIFSDIEKREDDASYIGFVPQNQLFAEQLFAHLLTF